MRSGEQTAGDVAAGGVTLSEGFVRLGEDLDSDLRVKLLVVDGRLSLMSDQMELGMWPLASVLIESGDDHRFDLTIDGETISYFPDAPSAFASEKVVVKARKLARKAARRRSKRASPSKLPPTSDPTRSAEPTPEPRTVPDQAGAHPVEATARKPSRADLRRESKERKDAERRARAVAKQAQRNSAAKRQDERRAAKAASDEQRLAQRRQRAGRKTDRREARAGKPHPVRDKIAALATRARAHAAARARVWWVRARWRARLAWYWAMDEMRQIDGWPFNRIPHVADEKRREPGHVHSYVARKAPAGIVREVCQCGKIKLTSRPIELQGPAYLRELRARRGNSDDTGRGLSARISAARAEEASELGNPNGETGQADPSDGGHEDPFEAGRGR